MNTELLEIQPAELRFTFEVKKQSSCSIQLTNKTNEYVAFKVKTTSPKKYCVRPTVGIIKPKASSGFTVIMQAHKVVPPDFLCKDKFLVQSTIVPFGTIEEDISSSMFSRDSGKYIDDKKLRVVLVKPQESAVLNPNNGELKKDLHNDSSMHRYSVHDGIENVPPPHTVTEDVSSIKHFNDVDDLREAKVAVQRPETEMDETKSIDDKVEAAKLAMELEEMKSKLHDLESKLQEADSTISKLNGERIASLSEKDALKQEIEILRKKTAARRRESGFPLLFVIMVAMISLVFGYLMRPYEKNSP